MLPDPEALEIQKSSGSSSEIMRTLSSEVDPLICPHCGSEMRLIALIDDGTVIERILGHLGLWAQGVRVHSGTDPPDEPVIEPWLDDPFPDYDTEPVMM